MSDPIRNSRNDVLTPEQQADMCRRVNRFVRPGMSNFERTRTAVRWLLAKMTGEIRRLNTEVDALRCAQPETRTCQWQPIETAPKGEPVIVWHGRMAVANCGARYGRWTTQPGAYQIHPTAWMPLPQPPRTDRET